MTHVDPSIERFNSLRGDSLAFVEEFRLKQERSLVDGSFRLDLHIILRQRDLLGTAGIRLCFSGIADLRLRLGEIPFTLPLLEVFAIRDYQWQDIRYKVKETEEEKLVFYCRSFTASAVGEHD